LSLLNNKNQLFKSNQKYRLLNKQFKKFKKLNNQFNKLKLQLKLNPLLKDNNFKVQPKKRKDTETIDQKVNIVQELITETETIIKMVKLKVNKVKKEDITIMDKMVKENQDLITNQNKKTETRMFNNPILILH
jgi:hypothetical protein